MQSQRSGRWQGLRTVRARTTILASTVVAIALLAGAIGLLLTLRSALVRSIDHASETRVSDLAAFASELEMEGTIPEPREDDIAQVVDASGVVVWASVNDGDVRGISRVTPGPGREPTVATVRGVRNDDDDMQVYRVWALQVPSDRGPLSVYLGVNLESVDDTMRSVVGALAVGLPVILGLLALSTWHLIGRALHPVEAIRSQVAEISQRDLGRRVPVPAAADEIGRLARTMNVMLDRLQSASAQQRTFVADASHELQSPLTSIRTQLEVARAHPASTDWSATVEHLLGDTQRLESLVGELLFLARTDESPAYAPERLDLDDIVLEEVARVRVSAKVRFDTAGVSAAPVSGSRDELARMTRNLLENAIRHAASTVRVRLHNEGGSVRLVVHDDGTLGIPPAQQERIFDRFVRLDNARERSGGTGLGLAIVKTIAERHGGTVCVDDSDGTRFIVTLPRDPPGGPAALASAPEKKHGALR